MRNLGTFPGPTSALYEWNVSKRVIGWTKARGFVTSARFFALVAAACALHLLSSNTAAGQGWKWSTETVDSSGRFTSLVVDKQGNVHLSYSDGNSRILKYAFRSAESAKW